MMDLRAAREATGKRDAAAGLSRRKVGIVKGLCRFQYMLQMLIYVAGFAISWAGTRSSQPRRLWLEFPGLISRIFQVDLNHAIVATTVASVVLAFAGAVLRTWAAASLAAPTAEGSFARRRQVQAVMLIGTVLHTLALCILMSWWAAALLLAATLALQIAWASVVGSSRAGRVDGGETSATGNWRRWGEALLREVYFWGAALSFAALGWSYNAMPLLQGLLVSLGLSIVVRGLMSTSGPHASA